MDFFKKPAFRWSLSMLLLAAMAYQLYLRSDGLTRFDAVNVKETWPLLLIAFLLMPVNWMLETLKWRALLSVHTSTGWRQTLQAVMGGIALAIFTPARVGEYGGRLYYMPHADRWPVAMSTLMGSLSQNIVAFSCGLISVAIMLRHNAVIVILCILVMIGGWIAFGRAQHVVRWICALCRHPLFYKVLRQAEHLGDYPAGVIRKALLFALLRYAVYTLQFILLLKLFEPSASLLVLALGVSALYLFHTLLPLPPVADVLARTNVAFILWAGSDLSELSISLASLIVWTINLLVPAMAGSIILGTTSAGKSFNTHDQHLRPDYEPVIADPSTST